MKKILVFALFCTFCLGVVGENKIWPRGYTFLHFLEDHQIPLKLYYNLPSSDKELTAEIRAEEAYQILIDKEGRLLQALIPIDEETQIHIQRRNARYELDFIPIKTFEKSEILALKVENSPHWDIFNVSKDLKLANEFLNIYRNSINFKKEVMKNDGLVIFYDRKYRFGQFFGMPSVYASVIETNKKPNFLFAYNDGRYYDSLGKEVAGFLFQMPLSSITITSKFSKARKHPVLKTITRPHFGVDFRAKVGTPIYAAGAGRVLSAGWKGGYGKAVEISHEGGLRTLYAHLSAIDGRIKVGDYVKKGQKIAHSGNTGLSSGPHLHFGLYKNNNPVDPLASIKTTKSALQGKKKDEFLRIVERYKEEIDDWLRELKLSPAPLSSSVQKTERKD